MIYKEVSIYDFIDDFEEIRPDNFTRNGLIALYEYFDDYEDIELDVIAICCEFSEYQDIEEIKNTYPDIKTIEDLEYNTTVILFDSGIIIQDY